MREPPSVSPAGLTAPGLSPTAGVPWRRSVVPGWPWWRATLAAVWLVGAVVSTVSAPLPPCWEVACTVDWGFAAVIPLGLLSVGMLWWRPLLALTFGVGFGAAEVALDPQIFPRVWFGVHGLMCLVAAARLLHLRRQRAAALRRESRPLTVPAWVRSAAARGPAPLTVADRLGPGLLALAAGVAVAGVLAHDVLTLEEHRASAERVTAVVVDVDDSPWYPTLEIPDPGGGVRTVQLDTLDRYAPGDRVEVLLDRAAHPQWVELVDEPADPSWQLPLAVVLLVVGTVQSVSALLAARARRRLLTGTHRGVRVLAARVLDGPDGTESTTAVATLADRLALAYTAPDRVLGRPGAQPPGKRSRRMPVRPVLGTLYGQLREGGYAAFLADDTVALPDTPLRAAEARDLRLLELEVADEVTSVGALTGPDESALAWAVGRRAFRGLAPAQPATSLPALPWSPRPAPRGLAEGSALLLLSAAVWPLALMDGMPHTLAIPLALAVALLCVTAAAPRLTRSLVVTESGLVVDGATIPWSWVRMTASGRGRVHLVVAGPPEDAPGPAGAEDLRLVRSRPLLPEEAFRCAAVVEALRRRPAAAVTTAVAAGTDPVRRFLLVAVLLHLAVIGVLVLSG